VVPPQNVFGFLFVALLVGLAGYYAWRQLQTLRGLRHSKEPVEDRWYFRNQAWRRLVGCVLMICLALLLAGWFLLGLEDLTNQLMQQSHEAAATQEKPQMNPQQRRILYISGLYMVFTLFVIFAIVCTVALDVVAIRRYGLRHLRQIQDDRRAMIEQQAARLRSERNGHG
jgi:nicotinamide riboside transporter PnuC